VFEKPKNRDWVFAVIGSPEWDKWLGDQRIEFESTGGFENDGFGNYRQVFFADWLWPRYVREFARRFAVARVCGALRIPDMKKDP
jgi:hypothetical protein